MPMDLNEANILFQQWKVTLETATGLSRDSLHLHIGLAVFVIARLIWRRGWGWLFAWLVALGFALGGEWLDIRGENLANIRQPDAAHWHDIWNTMLWPTALAIIGRWLEPRPKALPPLPPSDSGDESA